MRIPRWKFRKCLPRLIVSFAGAGLGLAADLAITDLTLRQFEGGRSWIPGYAPSAGETFAFDFRVAGFASIEGDFDAQLKLRFQAELVDRAGKPMAKPVSGASGVDIAEEDKKKSWKPKFAGEFQLPVLLARQDAILRVTVEDQIAGKKVTAEQPFEVSGPEILSGAQLAARNFRFLRTEEDADPLAVPAYRQGDTVWGRFEMVGFSTSEKVEVDLNYGLEVSNAAGKRLYAQEVAAEERKQFFYPPAYVPGVVSLQLQPNTPLGDYAIRLIVRDRLAGREAASSHVFRIE